MNFIELAKYCQENFKDEHKSQEDLYVGTIFVAILKDKVLTSRTPHILQDAEKCILIHEYRKLAYTRTYSWYTIETIDMNGCVLRNRIDDEFELKVLACGQFSNQCMELVADRRVYISYRIPFESNIVKILKLYHNIKDLKNKRERELVADLYRRDETILDLKIQIENLNFTTKLLEQERNQYKTLLDEINKLVSKS